MSGADQQDVPSAHPNPLAPLSRLEVVRDDVLPGLEPAHAADTGHVEEHPASDEPVLQEVDRPGGRALGGDDRVRLTVVEGAVVGHVAEGVDVTVPIVRPPSSSSGASCGGSDDVTILRSSWRFHNRSALGRVERDVQIERLRRGEVVVARPQPRIFSASLWAARSPRRGGDDGPADTGRTLCREMGQRGPRTP